MRDHADYLLSPEVSDFLRKFVRNYVRLREPFHLGTIACTHQKQMNLLKLDPKSFSEFQDYSLLQKEERNMQCLAYSLDLHILCTTMYMYNVLPANPPVILFTEKSHFSLGSLMILFDQHS